MASRHWIRDLNVQITQNDYEKRGQDLFIDNHQENDEHWIPFAA